jgi:hypothetical protein
MKGAKAVLPVTTMSKPNPIKTTTIGRSQYFFLTFMNCQNSDTILALLIFAYCQIA